MTVANKQAERYVRNRRDAGAVGDVWCRGRALSEQIDYNSALTVIESAVEAARLRTQADGPAPTTNYIAYCILQEIKRAGWTLAQPAASGVNPAKSKESCQ
jgi:hypothetical protein